MLRLLHLLDRGVEISRDSTAEGGSCLVGLPPSAFYFLKLLGCSIYKPDSIRKIEYTEIEILSKINNEHRVKSINISS